MTRAVIYTRKSTTAGLGQEFNSIHAQREACESYARQQGWVVLPAYYDDGGFSGASTDRPAFQRLMEDARRKQFDVIVVHRLDRLSRSLADFVVFMAKLNDYGVSFVAVNQQIDTNTPAGKLMLHMVLSFAEFERSMICERTREKVSAARRKGKWTGGNLPIGYDLVDKKLVVNPEEAEIVREGFRAFIELGSTIAAARHLNSLGHRTKEYTTRDGNEREGHKWMKSDMIRLIRNPLYIGMISSHGQLYPGEHEAIVDREVYDQAQTLMDANAKPSRPRLDRKRYPAEDYLLTGLLRCPNCGYAYTSATTHKKGRRYRFYRAVSQLKRGGEDCSCGSVSANAIEAHVVDCIRQACQFQNLSRQVLARVEQQVRDRRTALRKQLCELPRTIAQLEAAVAQLELQHVRGDKLHQQQLATSRSDLAHSRQQLHTARQDRQALHGSVVEARWVSRMLADFDAVWDAMTAANRRRLVHALVQQVTLDAETDEVQVKLADTLAMTAPASWRNGQAKAQQQRTTEQAA